MYFTLHLIAAKSHISYILAIKEILLKAIIMDNKLLIKYFRDIKHTQIKMKYFTMTSIFYFHNTLESLV